MKRLCFGTLMSILYQARNQKVTNNLLCDAIFSSYAQSIELRDGSLPGHLKSGRDNVPPDVIDAARNTSFEDAEKVFQTKVISLIKDSKRESVVRAIKDVLREDTTIQDHTVVGYINGYEKNNILINSTFSLSALLASAFYFAIIEVKNQECKDTIKGIDKKYVESFESSSEPVYFERAKADVHLPLQKTLHDPVFDRVFNQVSSLTISGLANPSNVKIYGVDVNNCKFKFKSLKEYLVDNIGSYVFSRAKANRYTSSGKSASIGAQALIRFMQAYGTCAETILGEMLLYVFMEQELNAPKIMSKIEIDDLGGMSCSKSDGVHLVDAAIEEGIAKFGGKKPNKAAIKLPLRDGDVERDDEAYKGHYFINANSMTAPQIVDRAVKPIMDRSEVYSGCYARVSLNFYAFNSNGNKGVACGLGNIQKIKDGEPLGGKTSAADDFTTLDEDDFLS